MLSVDRVGSNLTKWTAAGLNNNKIHFLHSHMGFPQSLLTQNHSSGSAAGQARAVAAAITGAEEPLADAPYFWSDQFGLRLQHIGHAESWHAVVIEGDETSFTARYHDRDGRLLAALAANRTAEVPSLRRELAA